MKSTKANDNKCKLILDISQQEYEESKEKAKEEIYQLAHDLKHHLIILQEMINKAETTKAQSYLNKMEEIFGHYDSYYDTGCTFTDIILHRKVSEAKKNGLHIKVMYDTGCLQGLDSVYLCSIMGNLFDNAYRAVQEVEKENQWIDIKIKKDAGDQVMIIVCNPYVGNLKKVNGEYQTTKKDKGPHGYGLQSIKNAVNKLHGEINIITDNQVFSVMILISNKRTI